MSEETNKTIKQEAEEIVIDNIYKSYPNNQNEDNKVEVLAGIKLSIKKNEFVTFFGPNGCGKTTLLYVVGGLLDHDIGRVSILGHSPNNAKIGFIFQNYRDSLLPWRNVISNILLPLEKKGIPNKVLKDKVRKFLYELNLKIPEDSFPYQLSGGQQQLIAIVRALISNPEVLLMDEPFASLDYTTRYHMQDVLLSIWEHTRQTVLFISHEIDEAIYLADRIVLLSNKPTKIEEILYNPLPRPRTHAIIESKEFYDLKVNALRVFRKAVDEK